MSFVTHLFSPPPPPPSIPKPPPPALAPQKPIDLADTGAIKKRAGGFFSTILTSPAGDLTPANTARKSLLGGSA